MPCTQHDDQDQQNRRISFRSTFSRTYAGLRFSDQRNLHSFSISLSDNPPQAQDHQLVDNQHQHYHNRAVILSPASTAAVALGAPLAGLPPANLVDLTEQIGLSHVRHTGGNITDVLDSFQESIEQLGSFSGNQQNIDINPVSSNTNPSSRIEQSTTSTSHNIYTSIAGGSSSSSNAPNRRIVIKTNNEFIQNDGSQEAKTNPQSQQQLSQSKLDIDQNTTPTTTTENSDNSTLSSANEKIESNQKLSNHIVEKGQEKNDKQEQKKDLLLDEASRNYDQFSFHDMIPPFTKHRQAGVIKNNLYNGSSFSGFQKSNENSYEVNVKIQHVDYASSYLCGYLSINHLTDKVASLTTFFEGEIISKQYPFLTRKWEATEQIDKAHWSRFEGFDKKFLETFNSDNFNYDDLEKSDYIFMRWKEHFLVPDHTIKHVDCVSYAGFYYICYSKRTSSIRGFYFHLNSEAVESFQTLDLKLDYQGSTQVYEFR